MALPPLPTETWQAILRHAINVPDFLDPASFEGDLEAPGFGDECASRDDEGLYWEAERIRNVLRCVCISWNLYLSPFDHRFVRMVDFWNGDVHATSLKKAIRISFTSVSCKRAGSRSVDSHDLHITVALDQIRIEQLVSCGALLAEIVDLRGGIVQNQWNSPVLEALCNVKVILAPRSKRVIDGPVFSQTRNVECIRGRLESNIRSPEWISRTLVTLSFTATIMGRFEDLTWGLPSLRHLRLGHDRHFRPSEFTSVVLFPLLRLVGHQLQSLYIDAYELTFSLPRELWDLCPNLRKLHAGMRLASPAPATHPIHTLWIPLEHLYGTLHGNFMTRSQWPNLATAVINNEWLNMTLDKRRLLYMGWNNCTVWKDVNGTTLEESIRRPESSCGSAGYKS